MTTNNTVEQFLNDKLCSDELWQKVTHWMPLPSPPINAEGA